jgi:ADP-heptose:LPS heptosyltransferase
VLLRFGGFGDMVAVTAQLPAIRKTWLDAHIDFITD